VSDGPQQDVYTVNSDIKTVSKEIPFVVIFNKRALAARALRQSGMEEAMRERDLNYQVVDATTPEEARCAAEEAARAGHIAVAAGGDGTVRDVVSGVLAADNPEAVVGHVPLGTGNDLARGLGRVGHGIERALDALRERRYILIDVGQVNSEYFVNVLGIGFDAEVAVRQSSRKIKIPTYFFDAVHSMFSYQPQTYRARWPDGQRTGAAMMITAMNGIFEGGGVRLAPKASLEDGLLDVYWIDPVSRWQFARYVWAVRWGTHGDLPMVQYIRTDRITVESNSRLQYHLDGEYREMTAGGSLEIVLHHRRLPLII